MTAFQSANPKYANCELYYEIYCGGGVRVYGMRKFSNKNILFIKTVYHIANAIHFVTRLGAFAKLRFEMWCMLQISEGHLEFYPSIQDGVILTREEFEREFQAGIF